MRFDAIVIGVSAGGFRVLNTIIGRINHQFSIPIVIVQHISATAENYIVKHLSDKTNLIVKEIEEKESLRPGTVYFAPPNYHVMVERNKTLSLTVGKRVSYARPSIDVLFDSAAEAYLERLLGIILTGANSDGSEGCRRIKQWGGTVWVQDPDEAEFDEMPQSVINNRVYDKIFTIDELIEHINGLIVEEGCSGRKNENLNG